MKKDGRQILKLEIETLLKIYTQIFQRINEQQLDVFLCGGASTIKWISMRDKVRDGLKKSKTFRLLYPEELFMEILNRDKQSDLLTLEDFLAKNCDIICIVCESPGSLVELGAFTNSKTLEKVVVVINEKYKKKKSFIMTGPVKLARKKNGKDSIFYYSENDSEALVKKLSSYFKKKRNKKYADIGQIDYSIDTLIGMYHFIPLLLYFYHELDVIVLEIYLKGLFEKLNFEISNYDWIYKSSIRLLYKEKYLKKNISSDKTYYKLTKKGHDNIAKMLIGANVSEKGKLYNAIRFSIMKRKYY